MIPQILQTRGGNTINVSVSEERKPAVTLRTNAGQTRVFILTDDGPRTSATYREVESQEAILGQRNDPAD